MGSSKSEDTVRCYLMNKGSILSQLVSSCNRPPWQQEDSTVEALSHAEFDLASNVLLLGVLGAGGEAAKGYLTEQIQSSQYLQWNIYSLENSKAHFYHLLSKINSIVLSNLKVINKKFEDWLPSLLVKINVYIDDSYLNISSSLSPNPELSLHVTSILDNLSPFDERTGIWAYLLDVVIRYWWQSRLNIVLPSSVQAQRESLHQVQQLWATFANQT